MTKSIPQARKEQKAGKRAATTPAKAIKPTVLDSGIKVFPVKEKEGVDWKAIELDYRAGIKTLRQIAYEHGITHGAVNKRAVRDGWDRDLTAKIRAKAELLVSKDAVSSQVSKESEKAVVDANAAVQADVIRSHRKDVVRSRALVNRLLDELEAQCLEPEELAALEDFETALESGDEKAEAAALSAFMKSTGLGDRADIMKKLAETLVKLVTTERVIFGITDQSTAETIEDRMRRIAEEAA